MADTIKKNIGKNTLGDNKKMEVDLKTYHRSTHDLSYVWRNPQSPGTLVPFMCEVAQPGDTHEIKLNAHVMTHPTTGPLFGSFKLQLDVFSVPIRLYNGWLHNNRLGVGLNMAAVKLPQIQVTLSTDDNATPENQFPQVNPSCLLSYLGIRGYGTIARNGDLNMTSVRKNGVPLLGYWDIFKNYYANKQEKDAYYIGSAPIISYVTNNRQIWNNPENINLQITTGAILEIYTDETNVENILTQLTTPGGDEINIPISTIGQTVIPGGYKITWQERYNNYLLRKVYNKNTTALVPFELENIDTMRDNILHHANTSPFIITGVSQPEPYRNFALKENNKLLTARNQFGLAVKTYNSDIFNNWINTEWIDGAGGINEITAVSVEEGKFTIDSLNLAKKVYEMLNRIAVSGGTYQDWIETVYTNVYIQRAETPVYEGGMSQEIAFQEVVSNSATTNEPLGTLAGRGMLQGKERGGYIKIKTDEPCYIMGIVSITPRIDYSQGNRYDTFYETLDDFHKPALDAIGFQDLLTDGMAYWNTRYTPTAIGGVGTLQTTSVGKQPAWINYMTNYNRTYGNFALTNSEGFMVLNRNYEPDAGNNIKDLTTYIDPAKYNYIFADTRIDAMNFWVQIGVSMEARRKMSAKVIPNL